MLRTLGLATIGLTAVSFLLFVFALWDEEQTENAWRWFGCAGFATLAASHASLVLGGLRATDTSTVRTLAEASVVLAVVDATVAILVAAEAVDDVDEGAAKVVAVLVVLLVLTSALQPILRRLGGRGRRGPNRGVERGSGCSFRRNSAAMRTPA